MMPPARSSAAATSSPPACTATPAITGSLPRDRKAMPSAQVMITGKANTQNTASGSRRNSRKRASVSSISGCAAPPLSAIAQVPSGQRHEDVLEGRAVGA